MRFLLFIVVLFSFATVGYGQFTTFINIPPEPNIGDNQSIGSDTQLNLFDTGVVGIFFDAGTSDGTSTNVEVNISGGSVGSGFDANNGSLVIISGFAMIGDGFNANIGSRVIIGGFAMIGDGFNANSGSTVNIFRGSVGSGFDANSGSTVNISGGFVGSGFDANSGSVVNLFGTQFVLDGMDITASLTLNEPFTIDDRDVSLSGMLANDLPFTFDLNSANPSGLDFFHSQATLTVTRRLPLPIVGDTNADRLINLEDLNNVRNNFGVGDGSDTSGIPGDTFPFDGFVNVVDLGAVRNNFGRSMTFAPEPSGIAMAAVALLVALCRRRIRACQRSENGCH